MRWRRSAILPAVAAVAALTAAPAAARQRAFVLTGSESALRPADGVADTAVLPNGDVALLTSRARIRLLDPSGACGSSRGSPDRASSARIST